MLVIFRVNDVGSRLGSPIKFAPDRIVQLTDALAVEIRRRQQVEANNVALRPLVTATGTTPDVALKNQALRAVVGDLTKKLKVMTAHMVLITRRSFGRSSERAHPDQQHLDEVFRQILVADALTPDGAAEAAAPTTPSAPRATRRGRLVLPDPLPTEDRAMDVPEPRHADELGSSRRYRAGADLNGDWRCNQTTSRHRTRRYVDSRA